MFKISKKVKMKKNGERVLIVEDNFEDAIEAMAELNRVKGKEIADLWVATNYESFLQLLKEKKPTLILSDQYMPGPEGFKNYRDYIVAEAKKRDIPVIFVTKKTLGSHHEEKGPILIVKEEKDIYQTIKEYETETKEGFIWVEAYELIKKKK